MFHIEKIRELEPSSCGHMMAHAGNDHHFHVTKKVGINLQSLNTRGDLHSTH